MRKRDPRDIVVLFDEGASSRSSGRRGAQAVRPKTIVIPMQNGIPYWYFHGHPGGICRHARAERRPQRSDLREYPL